MKNHGGRVRMESDPGRGTTFYLYLPATGHAASEGAAATIASAAEATPATVLVAEADGTARRELAGLLQELGYRVATADSGRQAILRFLEERTSIRAAILGRDMPGLSGVETSRLLRRMQPKLPVLLSGHPTGQEARTLRDADAQGMVTRPFRHTILGTAVSRLIEASKTETHRARSGAGLSQVPTMTEKPD